MFKTHCSNKKGNETVWFNVPPRNRWHTQIRIILRWFKKETIYKATGGVFINPTGFPIRALNMSGMPGTRKGPVLRTQKSYLGKYTLKETESHGQGCLSQPCKENKGNKNLITLCTLLISFNISYTRPEANRPWCHLG